MTTLADRDGRRLAAVYQAFGRAAVWRPAGGPSDGFAVVLVDRAQSGDRAWDSRAGPINTTARLFNLRVSDTTAAGFDPARGDGLTVGTEVLTISGQPRREDRRRLEWLLEAG